MAARRAIVDRESERAIPPAKARRGLFQMAVHLRRDQCIQLPRHALGKCTIVDHDPRLDIACLGWAARAVEPEAIFEQVPWHGTDEPDPDPDARSFIVYSPGRSKLRRIPRPVIR